MVCYGQLIAIGVQKAMGEDCLFPPPSLFPAINQFSMVIAQIAERHNSNGRKGITV
tara:strand:- start:2759 stop:2926 length:168 start_codon:yes stop_codon:yes gene_type:complete